MWTSGSRLVTSQQKQKEKETHKNKSKKNARNTKAQRCFLGRANQRNWLSKGFGSRRRCLQEARGQCKEGIWIPGTSMFIRVVSKPGSEKRCFYLYGGRNNWKRDCKPVIRNFGFDTKQNWGHDWCDQSKSGDEHLCWVKDGLAGLPAVYKAGRTVSSQLCCQWRQIVPSQRNVTEIGSTRWKDCSSLLPALHGTPVSDGTKTLLLFPLFLKHCLSSETQNN